MPTRRAFITVATLGMAILTVAAVACSSNGEVEQSEPNETEPVSTRLDIEDAVRGEIRSSCEEWLTVLTATDSEFLGGGTWEVITTFSPLNDQQPFAATFRVDDESLRVRPLNTVAERVLGPCSSRSESAAEAVEPTPELLPDRTDCTSIRGTEYRSNTEREWFLEYCVLPPSTQPPFQQPSGRQPIAPELPAQQPATEAAPPPEAPPPLLVTAQVIETCINGTFEGWSGDTVFVLCNGQVWQQSSYAYTYHYAYRPDVLIYGSDTGYQMQVDGVRGTISVVRLR